MKVWIWIKSYWYIPLITIAAILAFVFLGGTAKNWALDLLSRSRQSYAEQVAAIEALNKEKEERAKLIQAQYEAALAALSAKYATDQKLLVEGEKKRVKEIVTAYVDNPTGLTAALAAEFGFEVI